MQFVTDMWHPNIAPSGNVCISILHEPGEDRWGYERPEERWLPVHTVETIIIPANVDAAKEFRENYDEFKRKVGRVVRMSQENFS
ncbi:ubiquitin-conjugating enzyme E2 G1 [Sparganum proliferum]